MDTIVKTESLGRRHRRSYEPSFKADVVAASQQPGVSVAAVALNLTLPGFHVQQEDGSFLLTESGNERKQGAQAAIYAGI